MLYRSFCNRWRGRYPCYLLRTALHWLVHMDLHVYPTHPGHVEFITSSIAYFNTQLVCKKTIPPMQTRKTWVVSSFCANFVQLNLRFLNDISPLRFAFIDLQFWNTDSTRHRKAVCLQETGGIDASPCCRVDQSKAFWPLYIDLFFATNAWYSI